MCSDSHLVSVLLVGAEATLVAEEVHGWLVLPMVVDLSRDVMFDAKELPICITDWESDSTVSANVL